MCTVSWIHDEDGYLLLCNRDEARNRSASSGPQVETMQGVRVVAPRDGDHGGTWLASNELGVTVCLLNGTAMTGRAVTVPAFRAMSRGTLLLSLAGAGSIRELRSRLRGTELTAVAPFTVLALEPESRSAVLEWNGCDLVEDQDGGAHVPLVSSSFAAARVRAWRRKEFERLAGSGPVAADVLHAFHGSHRGGPSAYSPCMHRPGASTVSFSSVRVSRQAVRLFHAPGAPCRMLPASLVDVARSG